MVTGRSTIDDRYIAYLSRKERLKSYVDYDSFSVCNILYLRNLKVCTWMFLCANLRHYSDGSRSMKWLCRHKLNQPPPSMIILNRTLVMRYYFHHYQKHHLHPISHAVEYNFHLRLKLLSFHARHNCSLLEDELYLFLLGRSGH